MKTAIGAALATVFLTGCLFHKSSGPPAHSSVTLSKPIIQPDFHIAGEIEMVNAQGRFVVMNFPPGSVPSPGTRLDVFHNGLKCGEVKVSGPQRETDTVADIVLGDAQLHDEVRQQQ